MVESGEVINAVRYMVRSLADAADQFRAVADGLQLVPRVGAGFLFQTDVALMLDRERPGRGQP